MVEIKKINNVAQAQKICEEFQIIWRSDYHVIATLDGDEILQCAVFSYKNDRGEIYVIAGFQEDIDFLDGLCRAILNIMDINGVKQVYLPAKYKKLAHHVGFERTDNEFTLRLENFFNCGCCPKKGETK